MSPRVTVAVARRVISQLRQDPRTIALLLVVPCLLMALLKWMFSSHDDAVFDSLAPSLLALFPFIVMFLVTSVTTLRERTSGTLERLSTMPLHRVDLLVGYALAFGVLACVQAAAATALSVWVLDLSITGSLWTLLLIAVLDAILGTALGLCVSAFANTEFQAVQFMPALVIPQVLLCGLFVAREDLPDALRDLSDVLPLSYAVDAMQHVASSASTGEVPRDLLVLGGFTFGLLILGALTLRRRTP